MHQQTTDACQENLRMCKLFDEAVAEVGRLSSRYGTAKDLGAANAGELQIALTRARADGRAVRQALEMHMERHRCKVLNQHSVRTLPTTR
jgi:hypothetical protein